jgi:capsular exopolysaccharide synthesis family protein
MSTIIDLRPTLIADRESRKEKTSVAVPAHRGPQAYAAEQYRVLSHIVQQLGKLSRRVIAISSPVAGDGKTTTSINLARTLSQASEARVLLIDADLRRGTLGEQLGFGRSSSPGLSGMIADPACRLEVAVRRRPGLSFAVLPAGACPALPYEALRSSRTGEVLAEARERFDYVLVDTPPVVPVADLRAISDWVDGVFLVVSAHSTPRGLLDEALSALNADKVVGIIYNGDDLPMSRSYRSYYSYGQPSPKQGPLSSLLGNGSLP